VWRFGRPDHMGRNLFQFAPDQLALGCPTHLELADETRGRLSRCSDADAEQTIKVAPKWVSSTSFRFARFGRWAEIGQSDRVTIRRRCRPFRSARSHRNATRAGSLSSIMALGSTKTSTGRRQARTSLSLFLQTRNFATRSPGRALTPAVNYPDHHFLQTLGLRAMSQSRAVGYPGAVRRNK